MIQSAPGNWHAAWANGIVNGTCTASCVFIQEEALDFRRSLSLRFQRCLGLPYRLQPTLPKGQLLQQLLPTLVLAVTALARFNQFTPYTPCLACRNNSATPAANRASGSFIRR